MMEVEEEQEHKQCLLYLYLVGYAVKYYLNGQSEGEIFLSVLLDEIKSFE